MSEFTENENEIGEHLDGNVLKFGNDQLMAIGNMFCGWYSVISIIERKKEKGKMFFCYNFILKSDCFPIFVFLKVIIITFGLP